MDSNDVRRAVVVGAGVMGHSMAHVFAQAGIEVNLVEMIATNTGADRSGGQVDPGDLPRL